MDQRQEFNNYRLHRFRDFISLITCKIVSFFSLIFHFCTKWFRKKENKREDTYATTQSNKPPAKHLKGDVHVRVGVSKPINLGGYLLVCYHLPIIIGILLSFLIACFYSKYKSANMHF